MVRLHFPTNIQTHTNIPASINFLGPAELGLEPGTLGLKDERAKEKDKRWSPFVGL